MRKTPARALSLRKGGKPDAGLREDLDAAKETKVLLDAYRLCRVWRATNYFRLPRNAKVPLTRFGDELSFHSCLSTKGISGGHTLQKVVH